MQARRALVRRRPGQLAGPLACTLMLWSGEHRAQRGHEAGHLLNLRQRCCTSRSSPRRPTPARPAASVPVPANGPARRPPGRCRSSASGVRRGTAALARRHRRDRPHRLRCIGGADHPRQVLRLVQRPLPARWRRRARRRACAARQRGRPSARGGWPRGRRTPCQPTAPNTSYPPAGFATTPSWRHDRRGAGRTRRGRSRRRARLVRQVARRAERQPVDPHVAEPLGQVDDSLPREPTAALVPLVQQLRTRR